MARVDDENAELLPLNVYNYRKRIKISQLTIAATSSEPAVAKAFSTDTCAQLATCSICKLYEEVE